MSDPDLSKRLESMEKPQVTANAVKSQIRLTLMSTRTSSHIGIVLVLLPALFIGAVVLHYGFGLPVPGFTTLEGALTRVEQQKTIPFLAPLILVGAPLIAVVVNLLAVLHVERDRRANELRIFVKLRWVNLTIVAVALLVVAVVFVHSVADR